MSNVPFRLLSASRSVNPLAPADCEKDPQCGFVPTGMRESVLRELISSLPLMLALVDQSGRAHLISRNWEETLGWHERELYSRDWVEFVHPEDRAAALEAWRIVNQKGSALRAELRCLARDGSYRRVAWSARVLDPAGPVLIIGQDVTHQRTAEQRAIDGERMTSLAQMAGGVAHDFKNLLTVVMAQAQLGQMDLPADHPLYDNFTEINSAAVGAAQLADRLLAFSKVQGGPPENINLNELIGGMEKVLGLILTEAVTVEYALDPGLPVVYVDESQFIQVILNLCLNARDAMPQGGRLTIATRAVDMADPGSSNPAPVPKCHVELEIRDSGVGIPEHLKDRIFEPFFTTKDSRGTGLGLPTVYEIVRKAGGWVTVESRLGVGTAFHVFLPPAEPAASSSEENEDLSGRGSETILIVDDDPGVRMALSKLGRHLGYTVLEAGDGREAGRLLFEHAGRVDLVLSDIVMPGMNGVELASVLKGTWPGLKILLMSGYAEELLTRPADGLSADGILKKPLTKSGLSRHIRETLDGSPRRTGAEG